MKGRVPHDGHRGIAMVGHNCCYISRRIGHWKIENHPRHSKCRSVHTCTHTYVRMYVRMYSMYMLYVCMLYVQS